MENNSSAARKFHERSFTEKNTYIRFICQLGKSVFDNMLVYPGEKFSIWGFSLVAETPPLKSDVYKKLISNLVGTNKSDVRNSLQNLTKFRIYHFLKGWFTLSKLILRVIYTRKVIGRFSERKNSLVEQDYTIVSYFPYFDRTKELQGVFENRYLASFHNELSLKRKGKYGHVCVSVDIDGFTFSDSVRLANKFSRSESLFLIEEFISFGDVVRMIWLYMDFSIKYVLKIGKIRNSLHYQSGDKNIDIWPIMKNDFHSSFCGSQLALSLFYISVFRNMTSMQKRGSKIICICEMQGWERILYHFARNSGLLTIGYQHAAVSALELNYFTDPESMNWENDSGRCSPLPDYLATVGSVSSDIFVRNGWPRERVFTWGAQRFESLKLLLKDKVSWAEKEDYIVFAFSISRKEAERMLHLLRDTFQENNPKYRVYIKSHPSLDMRRVVDGLGVELNHEFFEFTEIPLEQIMSKAKAMVVTESSSCFYAMAFGCRIIVPRFEDGLDLNPLSFHCDYPEYVYSSEELRAACDLAIEKPPSPVESAKAEDFFKRYFYFPEDSVEYLSAVDKLKPISGNT